MRLECDGYFEGPFADWQQVEALASDIESGGVLREEFVVRDEDHSRGVHVAALFAEGVESPVGWLVASLDGSQDGKHAVCYRGMTQEMASELVFCGAPGVFVSSAVIRRPDLVDAVRWFVEDPSSDRFALQPIFDVVRLT